jgi:hypothetical protein
MIGTTFLLPIRVSKWTFLVFYRCYFFDRIPMHSTMYPGVFGQSIRGRRMRRDTVPRVPEKHTLERRVHTKDIAPGGK